MDVMFIMGQILTLISYLIFWISRFEKTKKKMLLEDNICRLVAILAFLSLKTYDGIKNTVFVLFRNTIGAKTEKKETKELVLLIMFMILVLMYSIGFNGLGTLCIAICGTLDLYGTIMCDEQGIREFGMIGSGFYAMFMILSGNKVGVICEIICFIMMFISYEKNLNSKKTK